MSTSTAIFNLFATEMGQFQVSIGAKIKTTEADIPVSSYNVDTTTPEKKNNLKK